MTMRIFLLALLAIVFCYQRVQAEQSAKIIGAGFNSCGTWTKAQVLRPLVDAEGYLQVNGNQLHLLEQVSWVDGFLSAFNFYRSSDGDVARDIDKNGVYAWIDNYCAAHPLDRIVNATTALLSELSKNARR